MNNHPKTSIVILTFNNLKYTKDCIESIRNYTEKGTYEIVIVDNNSTDDTRQWLSSQDDIVTVLNDENSGFPKGCNIGIQAASPLNDILLLNNDTILTPGWLENLQRALYSDEKIGAVGPVSNCVANQQQVNVTLTTKEQILNYGEKFNKSNPRLWEEKQLLIGFCFLIKRNVLETIGYLDELFNPGNFEDSDISLRVIEAGYKLILCHDTFIYHEGSATFRDNPGVYSKFMNNRDKFNNKWGFDHGLMADYRQEIIDLFNIDEEAEFTVLEVGCGAAMNLLKIKYLYPNAKVYGIEAEDSIERITRNLVPLLTKDYEDFPYDYEKEFFDYIILRDTLHHVKKPLSFVSELSKYLKNDGHILCSINNLGNAENVYNILYGNFYLNNQMKNYINFYTLGDILEIFVQNNFNLAAGNGVGAYMAPQILQLIESLNKSGIIKDTNTLNIVNYYLDFEK